MINFKLANVCLKTIFTVAPGTVWTCRDGNKLYTTGQMRSSHDHSDSGLWQIGGRCDSAPVDHALVQVQAHVCCILRNKRDRFCTSDADATGHRRPLPACCGELGAQGGSLPERKNERRETVEVIFRSLFHPSSVFPSKILAAADRHTLPKLTNPRDHSTCLFMWHQVFTITWFTSAFKMFQLNLGANG